MSNHRHNHHLDNEVSHQDNLNPPKTNTKPRKLVMFLLKCIIMACIISLFLLFLGFAALVLLHFLFITTALRRRRTNPTTGIINVVNKVNLPEVIYDSVSGLSPQTETRDCAICLEGFREGETCRSLPPCGHFFHVSCVDSWLVKQPSCPVCRTRVRLGNQEKSFVMSNDDWKIWWAVGN